MSTCNSNDLEPLKRWLDVNKKIGTCSEGGTKWNECNTMKQNAIATGGEFNTCSLCKNWPGAATESFTTLGSTNNNMVNECIVAFGLLGLLFLLSKKKS